MLLQGTTHALDVFQETLGLAHIQAKLYRFSDGRRSFFPTDCLVEHLQSSEKFSVHIRDLGSSVLWQYMLLDPNA